MMDLVPFAILIVLSAGISLFFKVRIESAIPSSILLVIAAIYLPALLGSLLIGAMLVWLLTIACVVYIGKCLVERQGDAAELLLRPGLVIFALTFVVAANSYRYSVVLYWDELRQWALSVRIAYFTNALQTEPGPFAVHAHYPPAMEIFNYFWMRSTGRFSDSSMFVSSSMATVAFLVSPLAVFDRKDLRAVAIVIVLLIMPYALFANTLFNFAYRLLVDPIMGIMFGWVLYFYYVNRRKLNVYVITSICAALFVLTLTKMDGIVFAYFAAIIILADNLDVFKTCNGIFMEKLRLSSGISKVKFKNIVAVYFGLATRHNRLRKRTAMHGHAAMPISGLIKIRMRMLMLIFAGIVAGCMKVVNWRKKKKFKRVGFVKCMRYFGWGFLVFLFFYQLILSYLLRPNFLTVLALSISHVNLLLIIWTYFDVKKLYRRRRFSGAR